jgi:hypothetical protein
MAGAAMTCDHDYRERLLVIRMEGVVRAELWMCRSCGDYIGTKPMSVREFLRDNPSPCDLHGGPLQLADSDMVDSLLNGSKL